MTKYAGMVRRLIDTQLATAAEALATPWTEEQVLAVERGDERAPSANNDLFGLVQRHLARVANLLENDDFSYARLFQPKADEAEVQCWVASCLKLVSKGPASAASQWKLSHCIAGDTRDRNRNIHHLVVLNLRFSLDGVQYSIPELKQFIKDQLIGRYMRPVDVERGIFLLVPLVVRTRPGSLGAPDVV